MVNVAKELEMIQCEGFGKHKGKRTCYSRHYGGVAPSSRVYLGRVYHS